MTIYVTVEADGQNKNITGGPWDVEDPSTIAVPEGQRLLTQDEAFAEGYHYAEGGGAGFAPGDTTAAHDQGQHVGDERGERGARGQGGPQQ